MNGYLAFYNGSTKEVYASSLYAAKVKAVELFKPKKSQAHMVTVVLVEKNGVPVPYNGAML